MGREAEARGDLQVSEALPGPRASLTTLRGERPSSRSGSSLPISRTPAAVPAPRPSASVARTVSGASYRRFAREHVDPSAVVRADGWQGVRGGLSSLPGLDQRPFDPADPDASLPVAHHVISNSEAMVQGTFHGLPVGSLQAAADEFSWRYSHRDSADVLADLVGDVAARLRPLALVASAPPRPLPRPFEMAVA